MSDETEVMHELRDDLSAHLDEMAQLFVSEPKITLIIRNPSLEDGDVVLTSDDDLEAAIQSVRRFRAADAPSTLNPHDWTHPAEDCDVPDCNHITRRTCEGAEKVTKWLMKTLRERTDQLCKADPEWARRAEDRLLRAIFGEDDEAPEAPTFDDSTDVEDLICQDVCIHCGDDAKHRLTTASVPWTESGDGLCGECKGMRDATATTACCASPEEVLNGE